MTDSCIKVLWMASWWPRPNHPVLGIFTQREAQAVAEHCQLVVLHVLPYASERLKFEEVTTLHAYQECRVYCPESFGISKAIRQLQAWRYGVQMVVNQGFNPDIVHTHVLSIAGLAAKFFCQKTKTPYFVSEHWSGFSLPKPPLTWLRKWLFKQVVAKAAGVFTVTQHMADSMQKLGLRGHYLVYSNIVDTVLFKPVNEQVERPPFRFVHVSNLDEAHKNISGLLRAYAQLVAINPEVTLTLIGGDEGTAHVTDLVKSLCLEEKTSILGVQPTALVQQELQGSHAFVLFSNREGLPCVMLEAMAMGLPVISSDVPGLEDWVTPETGILVPRKDEMALANAMLQIIHTANGYDKVKIRERIIEECSYPVVGKRILNAYEAGLAAAAKKRP